MPKENVHISYESVRYSLNLEEFLSEGENQEPIRTES